MKLGIIYTSTTPQLIDLVESELKKQLPQGFELYNLEDSSILADVREAGKVTAKPAARLVGMYMNAISADCDLILNVCSSVGEVAHSAQGIANYTGVPIVPIDEEMCREAIRKGKRIGVMATLPTTLQPTQGTILRLAREMQKDVELTPCLVENAFGLNPEEFLSRMSESALSISNSVDVIVFAQGSMAYCEEPIAKKTGKLVLSSPRFGALAVKRALYNKGLINE